MGETAQLDYIYVVRDIHQVVRNAQHYNPRQFFLAVLLLLVLEPRTLFLDLHGHFVGFVTEKLEPAFLAVKPLS